jgi:hypothetical protein
VVVKLGVPDELQEGPRTVEGLATAISAHAGTPQRLLRALAGVGLLAEDREGRFRLTRLSRPLTSTAPDSIRPAIVMWGEPFNWATLGGMLHAVRTGERAFDHVFGSGVFEFSRPIPKPTRSTTRG